MLEFEIFQIFTGFLKFKCQKKCSEKKSKFKMARIFFLIFKSKMQIKTSINVYLKNNLAYLLPKNGTNKN